MRRLFNSPSYFCWSEFPWCMQCHTLVLLIFHWVFAADIPMVILDWWSQFETENQAHVYHPTQSPLQKLVYFPEKRASHFPTIPALLESHIKWVLLDLIPGTNTNAYIPLTQKVEDKGAI